MVSSDCDYEWIIDIQNSEVRFFSFPTTEESTVDAYLSTLLVSTTMETLDSFASTIS